MLQLYQRAWGIDLNWVVTGKGEMFSTPRSVIDSIVNRTSEPQDATIYDPSMGTGGFLLEAQRALETNSRHMIPLPFYEGVQASAGVGLTPQVHAQAEAVVSFDHRFLRDKGATPERCNVITARGDSMAPTIPDGSLLVVDHSQTQITNGYIMVINLGDDLLVKRVRRKIDGIVELISDNPAYAPEPVAPHMLDQLRVVGRVVYFCRVP